MKYVVEGKVIVTLEFARIVEAASEMEAGDLFEQLMLSDQERPALAELLIDELENLDTEILSATPATEYWGS